MEVKSGATSIRFEGTDGWVSINGWTGAPQAGDMNIYRKKIDPAANKIWPLPPREHRNFLDSIKTGAPPTYTAEGLHRLSTVMHIGAISMELGKALRWDPKAESFDDAKANELRQRASRDDWKRVG